MLSNEVKIIEIPKEIAVSALTGAIRKVYHSITEKPLQVIEIRELTGLSARTIRTSLRTLKGTNLVIERPDLYDLRKRRYQAV